MTFGMDVMPLKAALNLNFLISSVDNTKMAEKQKCEVRATLAPHNMGSHVIIL